MRIKEHVTKPDWQRIAESMYQQLRARIESELRALQPGQSLAVRIAASGGDGLAVCVYSLHMVRCQGEGPFDLGPGEWTIYSLPSESSDANDPASSCP